MLFWVVYFWKKSHFFLFIFSWSLLYLSFSFHSILPFSWQIYIFMICLNKNLIIIELLTWYILLLIGSTNKGNHFPNSQSANQLSLWFKYVLYKSIESPEMLVFIIKMKKSKAHYWYYTKCKIWEFNLFAVWQVFFNVDTFENKTMSLPLNYSHIGNEITMNSPELICLLQDFKLILTFVSPYKIAAK